MKFLVSLIALGALALGETIHLGSDIFANAVYLPPSATDPAGACTNPSPPASVVWSSGQPTLVQLSRASDSWFYCKGTTTVGVWTKVSNSTYPAGSGIPQVTGGSAWDTTITAGTAGHVPRSNGAKYVDAQPAYSDLSGTPTVPGPSVTTPLINGTAAVGTGTTYARADHVHPTDTTRAASSSTTTINGIPCALNASCSIATGGGGGGGILMAVDTGTANHYVASPTGCSSSDLVDGAVIYMRPLNTSTGSSDFNYCAVGTKAIKLPGGSDLGSNSMVASTNTNYRSYELVYHATPIDKFELHPDTRIGNDTEIVTVGTDPTLATNAPQVQSLITKYAPLANNMGNRFQIGRSNGSAWVPSDTPLSPGSGRTYMDAYASSGANLVTNNKLAITQAGNCGTVAFVPISASTPRMVNSPTDNTTVGHSCIELSSVAVTWAGTEEVFDATIALSQIAGVSYFMGLTSSGIATPSQVLSYTSGNYPGAVVGFRFNPGVSGETTTWRCVTAKDGSTAPVVSNAGATFGTVTTNVTQLQFRLDEANGTAHWFMGAGGVMNEVCTGGSWGGNMPSGVALNTYLGEYITSSPGSAPILGISNFSLEVDSVPGVRP